MAFKIKDNLDLNGYVLQNFCVDNYDSLDGISNLGVGRTIFLTGNSTDEKHRHINVFDGTKFKALAFLDDVTNNADFAALKTKVEAFLEGGVDADNVLENLKEIQAFLDNYSAATSLTDILDTKADKSQLADYLPLVGGTLNVSGADSFAINRTTSSGNPTLISFFSNGSFVGRLGFDSKTSQPVSTVNGEYKTLLHEGNYSSFALPLAGGKLTGNLIIGSEISGEGALQVAGFINSSSVVKATSRLRVNSATHATVFGFIDAATYGTSNNKSVLRIGSCYGGSTTLDNFAESTDDNGSGGVNMTTINIYRRSVGIGKRYDDSELDTLYRNNYSLGISKGILVDGASRMKSSLSVGSLTIQPEGGSFAANLSMQDSSLLIDSELILSAGGAVNISSGIKVAFKTGIAQIRDFITNNIIIGATSGVSSNLAFNVQKYATVSNQEPASRTTLFSVDSSGQTTVYGNLFVQGKIVANGEVSAGGAGAEGVAGGGGSFYAETIPANVTAKSISHNLGTMDVVVSIYEKGVNGTWDMILTDVQITDLNKIMITFGSATSVEHRVIVMGASA